uniref:Uncharacterized protein n=1 Tax=Anguilla anguilla TaxID=7936 RepID=A0A0E9WE96_ANGAN
MSFLFGEHICHRTTQTCTLYLLYNHSLK